jgi:hypothetical protein
MRSILPATAALSLVLLGCGSDSTTNPTPTCTVSAVAITGGGVTRTVGQTVQLTAQVTSANCTSTPAVSWSAQPAGIVTLSATGLVTASTVGVATITATAGGVSGTTQVTVAAPQPALVRFLVDSIVLGEGDQFTLAAEARTATDEVLPNPAFVWSLIDAGPITLGTAGRVTGVTEGATARVQVRLGDLTDTARVWVTRRRLAFLWNDLPAGVGVFDADPEYSWNSGGGTNTINRTAEGKYQIAWPGVQRAAQETEAVMVSAYGTPFGAWCGVDSWSSATASVTCRNTAGAEQNASFTAALIGSTTLRGRSGFAWIQSATTAVAADPAYAYSPAGRPITSTPLGIGEYRVRFEGLGRQAAQDREAVIVSPYGSNAHCQPTNWTSNAGHLDVTVRCYDPLGAAANSRFVVVVVDDARPSSQVAFLVADQPTAVGAYQPANQAIRPGSGTATVEGIGPGTWDITLPGFYRDGGREETFLVSTTGTTAARCAVVNWGYSTSAGSPSTLTVRCGTPGGTAANVPFVLVGLQ